jgi:hypothetical protein
MRQIVLLTLLLLLVGSFLTMFVAGLCGVIWRRKLVVLLRERHSLILQTAAAAPDVAPLGVPIASSSRLLRVVKDSNATDPDVLRLARTLRRLYTVTLTSAFVLIVLMWTSKTRLWSSLLH